MVLFAAMLPVILGFVGLTIEAQELYAFHADTELVAMNAAAAGANKNRFDGVRTYVIETDAAQAAQSYLTAAALRDVVGAPEIITTSGDVTVRIRRTFRPRMLGLLGVGQMTVTVSRTKVPRTIL